MDARKTIEKLKGESDRKTMSIYLSESVFEDFKKACGDLAPSRVLEELMKEFVEDIKKTKTKTRTKKK